MREYDSNASWRHFSIWLAFVAFIMGSIFGFIVGHWI